MVFLSCLTTMVLSLLSMSFFTLLEQKVLAYLQSRKGPNKVSFKGVLQPFSDAVKLLSKQTAIPLSSSYLLFFLSPMLSFFLALLLWSLMPFHSSVLFFPLSVMVFILLSSLSTYPTLLSGWSSNSKYSGLGSYRSLAQTISYEVSMIFVLLPVLMVLSVLSFGEFKINSIMTILLFSWSLLLFLMTALAETNRTPFDLTEGESELVSGFNTEFGSVQMTLLFMAEYLNILFMSGLFSLLCLPLYLLPITLPFISLIFLWARGSLPRVRYDVLMSFTWKGVLPFVLCLFPLPYIL